MPREGAVTGILQTSKQFEVRLHEFLGKDYDGLHPDRAPYPSSKSLVGKQGEFILYRLTGSPMFSVLKSSITSIALVAENVLAETPGKATFDWIRKAVGWIERLDDAVSTESPFENVIGSTLIIPGPKAKKILNDGEEIFLRIPDDLRRTLSTHGIFVSSNKQDKTLRVVSKKDGAHHSIGGMVIRWCAVLFDGLRSDVSNLIEWEQDLTKILENFNSFFAETRSQPKNDEAILYRWHGYRNKVADLLDEGKNTLVVAPVNGVVDSFRQLLESITKYLEKHSSEELSQRFLRERYNESISLLADRFLLLDSMLHRKSLSSGRFAVSQGDFLNAQPSSATFRDNCRMYLEKALINGVKILGLDDSTESSSSDETVSFCALKAWEIENELFDRFQATLGWTRMSDEYRDKARSLRHNLEDKSNPTLAPRVLLGDIEISKLVVMDPEQLASQKRKLDRARAESAAKRGVLLTAPAMVAENKRESILKTTIGNDAENSKNETTEGIEVDRKKASDVGMLKSQSLPEPQEADHAVSASTLLPAAKGARPGMSALSADNLTGGGVASAAVNSARKEASPFFLKTIASRISSSKSTSRPPPPPSLAASVLAPAAQAYSMALRDRGQRVTNSSGTDRFKIEIKSSKIVFVAGFYAESDLHMGINGFLPEHWADKGRLEIKAFAEFLADKVSRGKWLAVPLRLTTFSDHDSESYKKFYKEYEVKNRIAMFAIGQSTKIFLVTPRFHGAAVATGFVSLLNKTSSYAIVLTKARLSV